MSAASITDAVATIPSVNPLGTPNSVNAPTTPADQAVSLARDIPSLIKQASVIDPDLAAKWTGKALVTSKTIWGTFATMLVSWIVTKYGLGWDADTCAVISGSLIMAATAGLRSVSKLPITGLFRAATTSEAVKTVVDQTPTNEMATPLKGS